MSSRARECVHCEKRPTAAVNAKSLLTKYLADTRGEMLDHPDIVQHYRAAHDISVRVEDDPNASTGSVTSRTSTEDLRQGLVHYRALFTELLEPDDGQPTQDRATG